MPKIICEDKDLRPTLGTEGSAGYDLKLSMDISIGVGRSTLVGTGVRIELPKDIAGFIVPRSSTGKKGLSLTNTVGLIDSDYQGEILLNIYNQGNETFLGYKYDTLFQLVLVPVVTPTLIYVKEFEETTKRGEGGFGSTDILL
jgi:dUTP pyrophosphatase